MSHLKIISCTENGLLWIWELTNCFQPLRKILVSAEKGPVYNLNIVKFHDHIKVSPKCFVNFYIVQFANLPIKVGCCSVVSRNKMTYVSKYSIYFTLL